MTLRKVKAGLLIAFALCLGCIANAEQNISANTKNTLWRVSSEKNSVYLLGSLHLLKSDNYPLDNSIDRAFDDSQILVLEVDLSSQTDPKTQHMMLAKGMLPEGDSLDKRISKKTYELARAKTAELGLDIAAFKQFKPWFFTMTLVLTKLQTLGFSPQYGLDLHFFKKATQSGKQVLGLETFEAVTKDIPIPVFAIGGVNLDNIKDVMDRGASGASMISGIFGAKEIKPSALKLLKVLK